MAIIDQTDARVLRFVDETKSITRAARAAGISYRNAWDRVRGMESRLGFKVVETRIGGSSGGGARLTARAAALLFDFRSLRKHLYDVMAESGDWDVGGVVSRTPGPVKRARAFHAK